MSLIQSNTTPKLRIFIHAASTMVPVSGLGGGTAYFINDSGSAVAATNTLVEVDATNAKGWYTIQIHADDGVTAGLWTLSYQTPTTFANVGSVEFTVNAPVDVAKWLGTNVLDLTGTGTVQVDIQAVDSDEAAATVLASSLQGTDTINIASQLKRAVALAAFGFVMIDATTGAPVTGKTVTCTRSIDGGVFGSGSLSSVTEIANGWYRVDFAASDLNGKCIAFRATASGCRSTDILLVTDP